MFDYIDGGAEDERTMAENSAAFRRIGFHPRVLRGVGEPDPSTTLLGRPLPIPLVLAPTGFTRIADPEGELAVARAAARAGLPYTLSTLGTRSIEEVADVSDGRKWFQLYMFRDRGLVEEMVKRAAAPGFEALVFTVDLTVHGRRERDVRRGFELPPKIGLDTLLDGAIHPSWTWHFVRGEPIRFANVAGEHVGDGSTAVTLADYIAEQMDPGLTWTRRRVVALDLGRPDRHQGHPDRRRRPHRRRRGHRRDRALEPRRPPARLRARPSPISSRRSPTRWATASRSSATAAIRRGSDIVKAVALGARACMAGRAYLYGLGAAGERGVDHVLAAVRRRRPPHHGAHRRPRRRRARPATGLGPRPADSPRASRRVACDGHSEMFVSAASAAGEGAAVDGVELAGDPRALVGAEVHGHPGDVLAGAGPAERDLALDHGVPRLAAGDVVQAEGVDDAGADRVHADAVAARAPTPSRT